MITRFAAAGYREFLQSEGIEDLRAVFGRDQILSNLADYKWDLLILDIQIKDVDGLEFLRSLCATSADVPVLVVSGLPQELYAQMANQAGASGYLPKSSLPEDFTTAVRRILAGQRYVSDRMLDRLIRGRQCDRPPHETLSPRERKVFLLIGSGMMLTRIAQELQLSVKTVSTYRS